MNNSHFRRMHSRDPPSLPVHCCHSSQLGWELDGKSNLNETCMTMILEEALMERRFARIILYTQMADPVQKVSKLLLMDLLHFTISNNPKLSIVHNFINIQIALLVFPLSLLLPKFNSHLQHTRALEFPQCNTIQMCVSVLNGQWSPDTCISPL